MIVSKLQIGSFQGNVKSGAALLYMTSCHKGAGFVASLFPIFSAFVAPEIQIYCDISFYEFKIHFIRVNLFLGA